MARLIQIKMKTHLNFALELGNLMSFLSLWWGLTLTFAELFDFSPDLKMNCLATGYWRCLSGEAGMRENLSLLSCRFYSKL